MRLNSMNRLFGTLGRAAIAFAMLITSALASDPIPALDDISTYTVCASENQSFALPGTCDVAYGANGKFAFKAAQSGTIIFNNSTFGDPIVGVAKSGYYRAAVDYPVSTVITTGTGLTGDYYSCTDLSGTPLRRLDPTINFPWGGKSPATGIAGTWFSVRWTGQIQTRFDGDCTLLTTSDDGIRVWIDGRLLIDNWTPHGTTVNQGTFASVAGQRHDIRVEYFQASGGNIMRLEWQSASEWRRVVPTTCLYPQGADTPALPLPGQGLAGVYYSIVNYSSIPVLARIDSQVNFDWNSVGGSPGGSVPLKAFRAVWSGLVQAPVSGIYTFRVTSGNDCTLWIGGTRILDRAKGYTGIVTLEAGQSYDLCLRYDRNGGTAQVMLEWEAPDLARAVVPASCLTPVALPAPQTGTGTGLSCDYYANVDLCGPSALSRVDSTVNYSWNGATPAASVPGTGFSVRWIGKLQTRFDGEYTLITTSDDGVRLWIDGQLLIDNWTYHGTTENRCIIRTVAGQKHDIRLEYFQGKGGAVMRLEWESLNEARSVVPSSSLYPYNLSYAIPASSSVSPAFLEGFYGSALPVINTGTLHALGEARFYADVPLSATETTPVTLSSGDATATGAITWAPTVLTNGRTIVVRPGDALLMRSEGAGNLKVHKGYDVVRDIGPVTADQATTITFADPGTYTITLNDESGARLTEMWIRVPGVVEDNNVIACSVNYTRIKDINFVGATDKDLITWTASDPWIYLGSTAVTGAPATMTRLTVKPTQNWEGWMMGRINGAAGPILANKKIRPFTLKSDSEKTMKGITKFPDGSILCEGGLVMDPLVLGLDIRMHAFVAGVTFDDSTTLKWITSDGFTVNESGVGKFTYRLIKAPGVNTGVCHAWVVYQNKITISAE